MKRLLLIILLAILFCSTVFGQLLNDSKPLPGTMLAPNQYSNGLVALYTLTAHTGNLPDSSHYGNHGDIIGPTWQGQGLSFVSASSQYVDLGSTTYISSSQPFTIIIRLNLTTWGNTEAPFSFKTNETSGFTSFFLDNVNYKPFAFGGAPGEGWDQFRPSDDFSSQLVGQWNHLAIVYDGVSPTNVTSFAFYLNGINKSLTTAGNFAEHGNVNRLGQQGTAANYLNGSISNVSIYSRVLSASEVEALYINQWLMFQTDPIWMYYTAPGGINIGALMQILRSNGVQK